MSIRGRLKRLHSATSGGLPPGSARSRAVRSGRRLSRRVSDSGALTRDPPRRSPSTACPEGAGLRNLGSRRMASLGSRGTVLLEAAGAFVVALAARRPLVLLPPAVRGAAGARAAPYRAGWSGRAGPGRTLVGPEARGQSPLCWPPAGRAW